jgi:hypothetical protein
LPSDRAAVLIRKKPGYNSNVRFSGFVQSRYGVFPTNVDDSDKEDSLSNFIVRKAAVLGAGVMGAQIAAHLANADVPVMLFDLPAKEGDPNGIVNKAIDALKKLEPSPLATKDRVATSMPPTTRSTSTNCANATWSSKRLPKR